MRYEYLNNFPNQYVDLIKQEWAEVAKDLITYKVIQKFYHAKFNMYSTKLPFDVPGLSVEMCFFVCEPNFGRSAIHTDALTGINVPIQVDPILGPLIYGIYEDLNSYTRPAERGLWTKATLKTLYDYDETKFENVTMDRPVLMNSQYPHGWANHDTKLRIIAKLNFDTDIIKSIEDMRKLCADNGWM
jgi:hypothetical protein